jgi:probable phosphoglycerate mutase
MPGVHLNSKGEQQAERLAVGLARDYALDAIVSSPMERALETARPTAQAQQREICVDEKLTEIDVGRWTGLSFEQLASDRAWADFNSRRSISWPPGGESMMAVQTRAWQSVSEHAHANTTTAFVTHGDVVRCLVLLLLGLAIDHIHRIEISPASVTEFALSDSYPVLKRMNYSY